MTTVHLETTWPKICQALKEQLNADVYARWIAVINPRKLEADTLVLSVSNDFYQSWLEENYLPLIKDAASRICGCDLKVILEVHPEALSAAPPAKATIKNPAVDRPGSARALRPGDKVGPGAGPLNPKYLFASFVVGPSNEFAHATALAVAQAPGKAYNPLFIYGGTGLGKTHLMQAIGHYVHNHSKAHVNYISCEALMNEYIDSLQNRRVKYFRDKYRNTDLLLIDDIHFLTKTAALQEEFFHTFNVLYDAHKQIVMTSDRPVNEISHLEQRLVSRFEWGLVTELIPPDFETRMAILRFKQRSLKIQLPEDIIVFIATHIQSNVRVLEGALIRLTSYASLYRKPVTAQLAEHLLQSTLDQEKKEPVTLMVIQRNVAEYFDIRLADMTSAHRSQSVALPRQVAMYLCRTLTTSSFPEIGMAFGKTHATVLHACRRVGQRMEKDTQLKQAVGKLAKQIELNPVK
ncbi:MAG: chromosomal replication initiator protein DnaA [Verrucomicrobia bacterium]|nr:chromosomal replication initiator protein DnaA [Verrucomicrobiota bacterium]MBU4286429.1 chromosomal replication initiator protein DnaA [Verrucomicrobiota bacterium]